MAKQGSAGGRLRVPQWIWPATIAGLIIAASHRPTLAAPEVVHGDKVVHFAVYGLLATLVCRLGAGWRAAGWSLLAVSGFGVVDEWHQSFVPGRFPSVADWIADTLGAGTAVAMYVRWGGYRRLLEMRIGRAIPSTEVARVS